MMDILNCPKCNSKLKKAKVEETYLNEKLGKVEGFICSNCGETLLTEESVKKAMLKIKNSNI